MKTPWSWLTRFPVYFQAIQKRLEKLNRQSVASDLEIEKMLQDFLNTHSEVSKRHLAQGVYDEELVKFRFMIEELRVSLFSQQLGTAIPVSEKRLAKQIDKLQ